MHLEKRIERLNRTIKQRRDELAAFLDQRPPVLTPSPLRADRATVMWKSVWCWIRQAEQAIGYFDRKQQIGGPGVVGLFAPWAMADGLRVASVLPSVDSTLLNKCNEGFEYLLHPTCPDDETRVWEAPVDCWPEMEDAAQRAFLYVYHVGEAINECADQALLSILHMNSTGRVNSGSRDWTCGRARCRSDNPVQNVAEKPPTRWLTKEAAAHRMNCSQRQVDRWAAQGKLTKQKWGTSRSAAVRFDSLEIDRLMALRSRLENTSAS